MFKHETVLRDEAVNALQINPEGTYVDCTLGGAGHSLLIASRLKSNGILIGLDQDSFAIETAQERLKEVDCQLYLLKSNFNEIKKVVNQLDINQVDGIIFDLGISSPQVDQADRGFSYHQEAPLDMRMDTDQAFSAYHIVNEWSDKEITRILYQYGEEKFSQRIAKEIVKERKKAPISTTIQLVEIIKRAIPAAARRSGPHPARRTFQAIRIAVNDEINVFHQALGHAVEILKPGGRICVITFHSLEDRICKKYFQEKSIECICPPNFPICNCQHQPLLRLVTKKPIIPLETEIEKNPRARSAKLRVAERR